MAKPKKATDNGIPPPPAHKMRRFLVYRKEDESGVSGTGYIAEGVEWTDGSMELKWTTRHRLPGHGYPTVKEFLNLHGHEDRTTIIWIDDAPEENS